VALNADATSMAALARLSSPSLSSQKLSLHCLLHFFGLRAGTRTPAARAAAVAAPCGGSRCLCAAAATRPARHPPPAAPATFKQAVRVAHSNDHAWNHRPGCGQARSFTSRGDRWLEGVVVNWNRELGFGVERQGRRKRWRTRLVQDSARPALVIVQG